jgi:hypothetical protein
MSDLMCPFSTPLIAEDFACPHAEPVIRRGGTEIACSSETARMRCAGLHQAIKAEALADHDYADDLTQVPHSLLVRIQYGGLLGLQRILAEGGRAGAGIQDIDGLVEAALAHFGSLSDIPCGAICADINACKLPGRRGRKR